MKKVKVAIEHGLEGRYLYSAVMEADEVPFGLNGTGTTVAEAKADMLEAYGEIREMMSEAGEEYDELEFDFYYDIPSFLEYYSHILSLAGLERITGINQRQLSHYINGTAKPRRATVERFRTKVSAFAEDLRNARIL